MEVTANIIEFLFSFALFVNAVLFIPQAVKIFKSKTAKSISLLTFVGFLLIQLATIFHGVIVHDYLLVTGYLFSIVTCGAVILLAFVYRDRNGKSVEADQVRDQFSDHIYCKNREGAFVDVTDIRKNELERLKVLESIIADIPGHVFWKNKNGVFLGCNNQQAKTLGFSSWREVVGKTTYDMVWYDQPEEDRRRQAKIIDDNDRKIIESGVEQVLEEPLILPNGNEAIFLSKKTPLKNNLGETIGILGISFDITEQRKTERELQETRHKLEGMTLISAAIAHEMRTPLSAFAIATDNVKVIFPQLKEAYLWAKEKSAPVEDISSFYLNRVENSLNVMQKEVESASTFIDMALMNTDPKLDMGNPEIISIGDIIDKALSRYPFVAAQRSLVQWNRDNQDFLIRADELIVVHVLFNLIKNALYYIAKAGHGGIQIWLEKDTPYNKLYFKDTGTGIAQDILPRIFERFFSATDKSAHPAGVGLTFCKQVMESLKGGIACESVEGDYTLFILSFPDNM